MLSTMMTVLITVLLCLLALAVLLKYGLKSYFKRHLNGMVKAAAHLKAGGTPIAPRITMAQEQVEFRDPLVKQYMNEFKALSYRSTGRYVIPEMPYLHLWSGAHHKDGTLALVMECGDQFTSIDVIRFYEDGSVLGAGTNPFYRPENYPPQMRYQQFPLGAPARDVVSWMRAQPTASAVIHVTPRNLKALNTRFYAACTDFQLARPLPSFDEYRAHALQHAARLGQKPPELSEAQWRMGYEDHRTALLDSLDGALKDHLLQSGSISAREWDAVQHDLVFIHSRLMDDDIAIRALSRSDWTTDEPEVERLLSKGIAPAKLFEAIQELLPADQRFSLLATLTKPVVSRIYAPAVESDSGIETRIP
ncbi:hypothetical protein G7047_26580 [Diaphorobacter sp. HDW4A]|uniref:hypothetical protein n=1 Tax=Diaphorobacter sp. HDW4A TaxID=2714924 RepID=UPI00140DB409|nr:hypothetical protein [Diaphorobacter sp. HDW4A]QIL83111.1 hypothetical protein G7047_26580 [Diaphorobacter sp. HDW4A]